MTAIERTAYPRLTQRLSQKELEDNYTPTLQEIGFVNTQGRGAAPRLTRLVLLKTIQCIAAQTLNDPVDLINVAIEQLIYNRCELPAYSSLNRIAVNIRAKINQALYTSIASRLSSQDITVLDQLPQLRDDASQTDFIVLKSVPGKPLLTEMRRLENRLRWLEGLLNTDTLLKGISLARIQNFADEVLGQVVRESFEEEGGSEIVFNTCQSLVAYHNDNTLPLLWGQYATHSRTVLQSIEQLDLKSTSQDKS